MCDKVNGDISGAQLLDRVWSIWIKSHRARATLIDEVKVIIIKQQRIELHDNYPIVTRHVPNEKILFKDLPFDVRDEDILDYVYSRPQIHIKTKNILYARMRGSDRELTPFYSGDRFIYIKGGCKRVLPSVADIGGHKCRIFHPSQKNACQRCLVVGHTMQEVDKCDAYYENENIVTIRSPNNVLCNYYPCKINVYNHTFRSSEHGYQWCFCRHIGRDDLAEEVLLAPSAAKAKEISSRVPSQLHGTWHQYKRGVMREILTAKVKCCPEFRQALIDSEGKSLVEAVKSDRFWSSGLNPRDVMTTNMMYYPGENQLGQLLEHIRLQLINDHTNIPAPPPAEIQSESDTLITGVEDVPELGDSTAPDPPRITDGVPGSSSTTTSFPSTSTIDPETPTNNDAKGDQADTGTPHPVHGAANPTEVESKEKKPKRRSVKVIEQKGRKPGTNPKESNLLSAWVKRKLSPEKEAANMSSAKLSRDEIVSS